MKHLVVYFSFSGNNRLLAESLAERLSGDICPVREQKRRSGFTTILDILFRREPQLLPLERTTSDYEHIILVAPVWNAHLASPMRALIKNEAPAIADYSFITLSGYKREGQQKRVRHELETLIGHAPVAFSELTLDRLFPPDKRKVKTVSSYRARRDDLKIFQPAVDDFVDRIESRFGLPVPPAPGEMTRPDLRPR